MLNLKSKSDKSYPTHTIRFWEKEFKQIKPKILNGNRRYYDNKTIELLKKVKFLLKDQGMTIKVAKRALASKDSFDLDDSVNKSINKGKNNLVLKKKVSRISKLIKEIKDLK